MLYQIAYSSQATVPMSLAGLEAILEDARAGNEARGVTGALIYADDVFFQILEGEKNVVTKLMTSIARDTRHHSVKIIYEAEADAQAFQSWSMAYLSPTAEQMSTWAGLSGTATIQEILADLARGPERVPGMLVNVLKELSK